MKKKPKLLSRWKIIRKKNQGVTDQIERRAELEKTVPE